MVSRLVVPLAFLFSVFLVFSDWVKGPISLLAQSSGGSPGEGLQFHILSIRIDETRRPVATYQITDDAGHPLVLSDLDSAPRFTLARLQLTLISTTALFFEETKTVRSCASIRALIQTPTVCFVMMGHRNLQGRQFIKPKPRIWLLIESGA